MYDSSLDTLPLHNKDLIPKRRVDLGLFLLMIIGIPSVTLWELYILTFYYSTFNYIVYIHLVSGSFIVLNIIGNLYLFKRIDASGKQKTLPSVLRVGWKYCHLCNLNAPPRAYHCPVCDECVLRRDHHCMFAGCCVGYHNHRYYLLSVIYINIGAVYAVIFQWDYCFEIMGGFRLASVLSLAAPHLAFVLGFLSLYGFIVAVIHIFLLLVIALTFYLIGQQFICIYNGQTIHERKQDIKTYDLGWKRNFKQILGKRWYFTWISPLMFSSLLGDGLNFLTFSDIEDIKNV